MARLSSMTALVFAASLAAYGGRARTLIVERDGQPVIALPLAGFGPEAARLAGLNTSAIQADRLGAALALASRFNAATVLKGAGSVLAFPDGTWAINASGNAGLASGGTGDVLTGMLGALLAQAVPPKEALQIAVCLHGAAADALVVEGVGPLGLAASELGPAARRLVNAAAQGAAPR